jgi:hypothetical protein
VFASGFWKIDPTWTGTDKPTLVDSITLIMGRSESYFRHDCHQPIDMIARFTSQTNVCGNFIAVPDTQLRLISKTGRCSGSLPVPQNYNVWTTFQISTEHNIVKTHFGFFLAGYWYIMGYTPSDSTEMVGN